MQRVGRSSAKLVLLSIADRADEYHSAHPSITRLAQDTELDRKTVMASIGYLETIGAISVIRSHGGRSVYQLLGVVGREETSPKNGTSPNLGTSTKNGTAPVPKTGPQPVPKLGHKPINNQPSTNQGEKRATLDLSVLPKSIDPSLWSDFVAHRKTIKAPLSTQTALNGIARELSACESNGIDCNVALRVVIERGWRGIKAEWVENAMKGSAPYRQPERAQPTRTRKPLGAVLESIP